jgi:hypothetical protein
MYGVSAAENINPVLKIDNDNAKNLIKITGKAKSTGHELACNGPEIKSPFLSFIGTRKTF